MKSKSLITALAMYIAGAFFANASFLAYTYAGDDRRGQWGAKLAQDYDVAIKLPATAFVGNKIVSVTVPVVSTENISNYQLWLSSELTLKDKANNPDIMSVSVTAQDVVENVGFIEYTFDKPVDITGDIYIGYSFSVAKISSDFDRYPVIVAAGKKDDGFYVHSTKTYRQWQDRSVEIGCVSPILVNLEGDFREEAVKVNDIGDFPVQAGVVSKRNITILNVGTNEIASIGYELTVDGKTSQGTYEFETPVAAIYNLKSAATFEIPQLAIGDYPYTFKITKVNGRDNGAEASCQGTIRALEVLPVKRPVMEEYTGTWCGWCPRGWVAMEMMNAMYPDFVCISYHDGDVMEMSSGYPKMTQGFPSCMLDRKLTCDPFYGMPEVEFGIRNNWLAMSNLSTPAALDLSAEYDSQSGQIKVTSDVFWAETPEDGEYRVEYVLVGDGIYNPNILQANYYAEESAASYSEALGQFCRGGEYGYDEIALTYNDVALLTSGLKGVEGSVASKQPGTHNKYTYTFNLGDCKIAPLCTGFRVVAMLLKTGVNYGTVVNSNKCDIDGLAGIVDVKSDITKSIETECYYDLTGRKLQTPHGICIKQTKYTDGTVSTTKVAK